jgi:hypothetical protein
MLNAIFQHPNGRAANTAVNPASLALAQWQAADYADQQAHYVHLREWYDGDHKVPLTDRQREYLGLNADFPWSMNYLRMPVELCVERLTITGFDGPDGIGGDEGLLDEWWTSNRLDALQGQVHRATARDGDTYVLVEWDKDAGRPRLSHEPAHDGDEGMKVHYLSNLRREMTMASKVWTEARFDERGQLQTTRRLNLYLTRQAGTLHRARPGLGGIRRAGLSVAHPQPHRPHSGRAFPLARRRRQLGRIGD